jgi:hypothetical protein
VSVPRIEEVGPSFKADDEHFHVFILDDGRCAFVIGDVSSIRGDSIPIEPKRGVKIEFCKGLSSAKDEWEKCADDLEQSGVAALADRMREAWDGWSESREGCP